jgi:uridine kinase
MEPTVETYAALADRIQAGPPRCGPVRLIAIDGPSGAGKSTFARRLALALGGAQIVHTDDFASWDNPLGWWPRLEEQVLKPLADGDAGRFQRYDWERRELAEWHEVPSAAAIIIEGVSSARLAVADRLTCAVWIETGRTVRLRRGLDRDGEDALPLWRACMAEEDRHFAQDRTAQRADALVEGNPLTPHDPDSAYIKASAPSVW